METKDSNNLKPFSHICRYGTYFHCDRSDFNVPVHYKKQGSAKAEELMSDVAEMISFHALNIWETLDSFNGYDTVTFVKDNKLKL